MNESLLLAHIAKASARRMAAFPHVSVGPGDDCAVVTLAGRDLLLKVDQLIVGRHTTRETPLHWIARKAIARPMSDIAAMAGAPLCGMVSAILPPAMRDDDARVLSDALHNAGASFGAPIVGGDIATHAAPDAPISLSVTLLGTPHPSRGPVLRRGARVGDDVYVTGTIGGSFLDTPTPRWPFAGGGKHLDFAPRLTEATFLADTLGHSLSAMLDLSDGLGIDAGRLAAASGVRIELDAAAIPRTNADQDVLAALSQGEDYELLFTASPQSPPPPHAPSGVAITRIGRVAPGSGCVLLGVGNDPIDVARLGWNHGGH